MYKKKNFGSVPTVGYRRTKFGLPFTNKTTMNVGTLYPIDWQEVLPGDSFNVKVANVTRVSSSFIKPVMDNLKLEIAHFFVPYRLVFEDTEKVFGNPNPSAYDNNNLVEFPTTNVVRGEVVSGTVGDYLGLPLKLNENNRFSVLPFRAFALIYDKWFRNQNVVDEMYILKGDTFSSEVPNSSDWSPNNYFGKLPKVRKKYDYFTSCLPSPQKGAPIGVNTYSGVIPVRMTPQMNADEYTYQELYLTDTPGSVSYTGMIGDVPSVRNDETGTYQALGIDPNDLNFTTVNDLRTAFQLQRMLEKDARGGSRYSEFLLSHFGVYSPDSRLQLPEYLGGGIIPINIQQVAQTSATQEDSPLANVAGYSLTNGYSKFSKGFTEHGIVMTVAFIRQYEHSYSQGLAKKWTRVAREQFYDPVFANLGEQPVYKRELVGTIAGDEIFGYNEAWADYRSFPNTLTGQMRGSNVINNSLDIWHFGDILPTEASDIVISKDFVEETEKNVDRTLSVPASSQDQFLADFYFDVKAIRVMPMYSTPGLIDHH